MLDSIEQLEKELHCVVMYGDLDNEGGVCFPPELNYNPFICINENLPESHKRIIAIHELGHIAKQRGQCDLYEASVSMRFKMEREANEFLVDWLINKYVNETGESPRTINYVDFMVKNDIPSFEEDLVKLKICNYEPIAQ